MQAGDEKITVAKALADGILDSTNVSQIGKTIFLYLSSDSDKIAFDGLTNNKCRN